MSTLKALKKLANFDQELDGPESDGEVEDDAVDEGASQDTTAFRQAKAEGLNLSYTINLNLPATADIAVFDAIFKSLKENLLK